VVTTEFPVPAASVSPAFITAGPDGALWFTGGNQIARMTTAGVVTNQFPIPTANSAPANITVGSDGALWFTESNPVANKIGRITTAGVITEFTIPTANSGSQGITSGPDDDLWFAEQFTNKIGRITTSGVFTEFLVPTANSYPTGITLGADGGLWLTENTANQIGHLPPFMEVKPITGMVTAGYQGGPFNPASLQYQLSVTAGTIDYSISGYPNWLTPSSSSGTVVAGTPVTITLSVNAGSLSAGTYTGTISFTNTSTAQGSQSRAYTLTVNPPAFQVSPTTNIAATGTEGGPFSPRDSLASMEKIRHLIATYKATLFINHYKKQEDKLKLLPAFYD
jgi:hypothetical protein